MRRWTRAMLVGALGLVAGGALGCAEERAPINRVQPNALAKSFFVGADLQGEQDNPEFYAQGTLVDVGYGAAQDGLFTSTYAQPLSRIKWQITEDLLIGRLAYERIADSDGKAGVGHATTEGQIAYIYPIVSHFDIRRDYNPTTGEESNVVVENSSDRPWDQREFMRVDWSRNLNTNAFDYDTLSLIGIYGGVSYEPVSYYVNDPDHEDAPVFDVEDGYFDVTNKALASPGLIDLSHLGWGINSFPACYLDNDIFSGTYPSGNCNPVELTIRQSFRKVTPNDYEPQDWDGRRFQQFGAFTADRVGYARNYGMVDEKWHRFIARYDVWQRSHYYDDPEAMEGSIACNVEVGSSDDKRVVGTPFGADPHRDENADGTEDECEAVTKELKVGGSRCDEFKQMCTLPYTKRRQKPVVWHYSKFSNQEVFEGTEWAANEWDVALRLAVSAAKYAECTKLKGVTDRNGDGLDDECSVDFPVYSGQQEDNDDVIALSREVDDCRHSKNPIELGEEGWEAHDKKCREIADDLGAKRGYQPGVIAIAKQPEMIILCHGPVEANDPIECGEKRLPANISAADCDREWLSDSPDQEIVASCNAAHSARIGDLRYHLINSIKTPQTPSPWGIMVDAVDPLWGNKVSASINIWTHVNDLFSQGVVDTVRYIQGELPVEEITDGKYVTDWAAADAAGRAKGAAGVFTREQVEERLAQTSWQAARGADALTEVMPNKRELVERMNAAKADPAEAARVRQTIKPVMERMRGVKASPDAASVTRPIYEQRRRQVQGTETEAAIMTPAMQQYAGVDGSGLPQELKTEMASLFRGLNPQIQRDIRQAKEIALAKRGACIMQEAPAPNSLVGLSNILTQKFGNWQDEKYQLDPDARHQLFDAMQKFIAQRAQYAVIIHEMGHSMGHRHNFVSSSNAAFYRPQYWQLRTKNGAVKEECTTFDGGDGAENEPGERCVGPRYYDPPTNEESSQMIHMFMQSSVMDYAGEQSQDLIGLGVYDFAATRSFYGETVAVHASPEFAVTQPKGKGILAIADTFGGIVGYQHVSTGAEIRGFDGDSDPANSPVRTREAGTFTNYSLLNTQYNLINNCVEVGTTWEEVEAKYRPSTWNSARDGRWHPVLDGHLVSVDGVYKRCRSQIVDYVPYDAMRTATSAETEYTSLTVNGFSFYGGGKAVDRYNRTRVPYGFASDNWADLGNLAVYRHDNGADAYEIFNFLITEQETRHIFDNYRRGRQSFSVRSAAGRVLGRYNEKMRDGAKGLGLYFNLYRDLIGYNGQDVIDGFLAAYFPDNLLASGIAFDHFVHQIQRPQSGPHVQVGSSSILPESLTQPAQAGFVMNVPDGATGKFGNVSPGGKLLENQLADDQGDYDSYYTMNAGSYYDKVFAPYLLTESVDNFISDSIDDFVDARYRSVSMADMFPLGYQRLLGNMLTQDESKKGVAVTMGADGLPEVDALQGSTPSKPLGWTTYWTEEPEYCFPTSQSIACNAPQGGNFGGVGGIDRIGYVYSTVDWELWKFLLVQTMLYLPENARPNWINQMGVWEIGADNDPEFDNRIELHSPEGAIYVAKTSGFDVVNGEQVQRGIAARVIEYANELIVRAYVMRPEGPGAVDTDDDGIPDAILDEDEDGNADATVWYVPVLNEDGSWQQIDPAGNRALFNYQDYESLLLFIRQTMRDFRMAEPTMKGIYD